MSLRELSSTDLDALETDVHDRYAALKSAGLKLDLTRGKPSAEQLTLSNALLSLPGDDYTDSSGTDCRNYGGLTGLADIRKIFAELLHVPVDQLIAGDNSSLTLMHEMLTLAMLFGTVDSAGPWFGQDVKFICPVPGYDRHFAVCEQFGITMVPVELGPNGPDVAEVAELLKDPSVKGMWVVPAYANPTGAIYDEATTRALLELPAAPDFRIWWDNAYALHHLTETEHEPLDVLSLAADAGNPNRVFTFASTSKVTFAGAGVSFFGASPDNVAWYLEHLGKRSIGPDKVNHLRHAKFFGDADGVRALMRQHRDILAPKFRIVEQILEDRLAAYGAAEWTHPSGGYFISLDVADGTAARVVQLAKEAGIALTPAGSAFPHGDDPRDRNIRLAPSMPPVEDLRIAMDGVATCVLVAAIEQLRG